jgi:hypothetical protein
VVCGFPLFVASDAAMESAPSLLPPPPVVPLPDPPVPTVPAPIVAAVQDELLAPTSAFDWGDPPRTIWWVIGLSVLAGILSVLVVLAFVLALR